MDFDTALQLVNDAMSATFSRQLNDVELILFKGVWQGQTYSDIAKESGYAPSYLGRLVGPKFWQNLSQALGQKVSKTSFRAAIEQRYAQSAQLPSSHEPPQQTKPEQLQPSEPLAIPTAAIAPPKTNETSKHPSADWGEAPDVSLFYGRVEELATLHQWIITERCRLVALLGMGGIGKSVLSVKLAEQTQEAFDRIIWRTLRNAPTLEDLLRDIVPFVSNQQETDPSARTLLKCLRQSRCLMVFDNLETILQAGSQAGYFRPGYEDYGELLRLLGETSHPSCVVLTSREKPAVVSTFEGVGMGVRSLPLSGSLEIALALINEKGLEGTPAQKETLCQQYSCSPLALKIATSSIQELFEGNIGQFLQEETIVFNGVRRLLEQQFERLSELEHGIMYWLAINRDWTAVAELGADMVPTVPRVKLLESLESLSWRSLIEKQGGRYIQQPVVMEYVTERLTEQVANELLTQTFDRLTHHALLKTTIKDFVRTSQCRLILEPILHSLNLQLGSISGTTQQLQTTLDTLRSDAAYRSSYGGGNVLNLCRQLQLDITGYDFSQLAIWQAYLQDVKLHHVNFTQAEFAQTTFKQTFSGVLATTFSADGQVLATGDSNGDVRLWQVADGQPLQTLQGHSDWVRTVAFNPEGTLLASGSDEYTIFLWDLKTGQHLRTFADHGGRICTVMFSPDGYTLVSSSEDLTLRLWDVYTGDCLQVFTGHTQQVWSVQFDPSGQKLVSGGEDSTLKLWDVATGQCLQTLAGHRNWIWSVAFSPNGQWVASGSHDNMVKLWHVNSGECIQTFKGHTNWIWAIAFNPQGNILASGSEDQTVRLWDVQTGRCLKILEGHTHRIWAVAFSPQPLTAALSAVEKPRQQAMLASGSEDQSVRLWDISWLETAVADDPADQAQSPHSVASQCLRALQGHSQQVWAVAFSPDSQILVSGGDEQFLRLWDVATGKCSQTLQGHTRRVSSVAYSPDGQLIASCGEDQTIRLWEVGTRTCLRVLKGHTKQLWTTVFNTDGTLLASGGEDQTIRLWEVHTGKCTTVLEGHSNWIWSLDFSPVEASVLASASYDQTIKLWDINTGTCINTLEGHEGAVMAAAFRANGQQIASGSMYDQTVRLWSVKTGDCLQVLPGQPAMTLAFSPSLFKGSSDQDAVVAIGGTDQSLAIWHPDTGEYQNLLQAHRRWIMDIAFSPDGQYFATGGTDEIIKLWNPQTGEYCKTLSSDRPYEGMNITEVTGLSEAQKVTLQALGAIAH